MFMELTPQQEKNFENQHHKCMQCCSAGDEQSLRTGGSRWEPQ